MSEEIKNQIIDLMMDGRERTIDDVANKLKLRREVAKAQLYKMGYNNDLLAGRIGDVTIYRLPRSAT